MFWSWEAEAEEGGYDAGAAVEGGCSVLCEQNAVVEIDHRHCRYRRRWRLFWLAAAIGPAMMVAPAPLMAWWQMAGRVAPTNQVYLAGQAVPRMRVVLRLTLGVEAAVALDIKGRQEILI